MAQTKQVSDFMNNHLDTSPKEESLRRLIESQSLQDICVPALSLHQLLQFAVLFLINVVKSGQISRKGKDTRARLDFCLTEYKVPRLLWVQIDDRYAHQAKQASVSDNDAR